MRLPLLSILAAALGFASSFIGATAFKWARAANIPTWDIHSQNNARGNGVHNQVMLRAMKKNIDLYHRADHCIDMRAVKVN
jgi:hypothetical protein